jgi:hypothetical protein
VFCKLKVSNYEIWNADKIKQKIIVMDGIGGCECVFLDCWKQGPLNRGSTDMNKYLFSQFLRAYLTLYTSKQDRYGPVSRLL